MPDTLTAVALVFGFLGAVFLLAALAALRRVRLLRFSTRLVLSLAFLAIGFSFAAISLGTQGYRALTREEVAATVDTESLGAHRFRARIRFPDGREASYVLAGDELYIDAHILKWKPLANVIGLHTAYEIDRVAGRYRALSDEQRAPRTVHGVGTERTIDMFNLRRRYAVLAPLLDAEYGSATFVPIEQPQRLEVRVSTSGLLIRSTTGP
jgi:hypothetical protein